jgi:flagellin
MALEMVNYSKSQILQQAGTAMLSQANSTPQSILGLLRG